MDQAKLQKLNDAGIDVQAAVARTGGNEAVFVKCLRLFTEDASYEQAMERIAAGDYRDAWEPMHTLKGVSGNMGMKRLFAAATTACDRLRRGEPAANLQALETEYETVMEAVKSVI